MEQAKESRSAFVGRYMKGVQSLLTGTGKYHEAMQGMGLAATGRFQACCQRPLTTQNALTQRKIISDYAHAYSIGAVEGQGQTNITDPQTRLLSLALPASEITTWPFALESLSRNGSEAFAGTEVREEHLPVKPQMWLYGCEPGETPIPPEVPNQTNPYPKGNAYSRRPVVWLPKVLPQIQEAIEDETAGVDPHCGWAVFLHGYLFFSGGGRLVVYLMFSPLDKPSIVSFAQAMNVSVGDTIHEYQAGFFAQIEFLKLPFVHYSVTPLKRHEARQLEKEKTPISEVRSIVLRRKVAKAKVDEGGEKQERDWKCQWLVGGHWRRQWYPKSGVHRAKWINPYMKGDPDKPFMPIRETVFHAKR